MNTGNIVRDNPVDVMMDGWSQKQRDDFRVGLGMIERFNIPTPNHALLRREGTPITVRWIDTADGVPYLCYHHKEELSLYCPIWELWEL